MLLLGDAYVWLFFYLFVILSANSVLSGTINSLGAAE